MADPDFDPIAAMREVERLRREALKLETRAFREALKRAHWLEAPAARLLGMPTAKLRTRLRTGSLFELGEEARRKRAEQGYTTGRVPHSMQPDEE